MGAVTAPGVGAQTDLDQVGAVDQGEVAGEEEEAVVVQSQHLQRLQVTERLELDEVDQVAVEVELPQSWEQLRVTDQYPAHIVSISGERPH